MPAIKRLLASLICLLAAAAPAVADERVALVIGNSEYSSAPDLANPANDARAISVALDRLGFDVLLGTNLDIAGMRDVVREFAARSETADLALFFFAGHGIQVDGKNYLVPTDAELAREADLDFSVLELQIVLRQMERAGVNSIIFLDACRDNPFETSLSRSMGRARSAAGLAPGLAPVESLGGALIGFATDPGEVAFDGTGAHSPFTAALLDHIETPGIEINTMMTRVRVQVVEETGRLQRPWTTSSLLNELYLVPQAPVARQDDETILAAEVAVWRRAQAEDTANSMRAYLEQFPEGLFAQLASGRLAELEDEISSSEDVAALSPRATEEQAVHADSSPGLRTPEPACPLCPDFVTLPGGSFQMGSVSSSATPAEGPVTTVDVSPFAMSVDEITVRQFGAFLEQSGRSQPDGCYIWTAEGRMQFRSAANWKEPGSVVLEDMPAACISWQDAADYARWLSDLTGLTVRLPTEAELEYAIRAGSSEEYPFDGGAAGACLAVNAADDQSAFRWRNRACADGYPAIAPVTAFAANAFGLRGTTGSLWEWAADCWNDSHRGAPVDGSVRASGNCASRVLRGGSWDDPPENLRASYRVGIPATRRQANVGFRVVIDP